MATETLRDRLLAIHAQNEQLLAYMTDTPAEQPLDDATVTAGLQELGVALGQALASIDPGDPCDLFGRHRWQPGPVIREHVELGRLAHPLNPMGEETPVQVADAIFALCPCGVGRAQRL